MLVSVEIKIFEKTNNNTVMRMSWYVPQQIFILKRHQSTVLFLRNYTIYYLSRINRCTTGSARKHDYIPRQAFPEAAAYQLNQKFARFYNYPDWHTYINRIP